MQLIIYNKKDYSKNFIFDYLPLFIKKEIISGYNPNKVREIQSALNLNILNIIEFALDNLCIRETSNSYIISINETKKYKGYSLQSLINLITYGSLNFKGYKLIINILDIIAKNLDIIYREWLDGN